MDALAAVAHGQAGGLEESKPILHRYADMVLFIELWRWSDKAMDPLFDDSWLNP